MFIGVGAMLLAARSQGRIRRVPRHLQLALSSTVLGAFLSILLSIRPAAAELPATRLRIRIAERGIYELTPADLEAAGVPVAAAGFDPRTLRLYFDSWKPVPLYPDSIPSSWQADHEMSETALWVVGEEDGQMDADDRVVFYALGPAGWDDLVGITADSLAHSEHPYDRFNYGWLVWGGPPGLRMATRPVAAPEPLTGPFATQVGHREHREEDRTFVPLGDMWAWADGHSSRSAQVAFDLDLGADSSATGALRLQLGCVNGWTQGIEVRLNDVLLGTSPFIPQDAATWVSFGSAALLRHNVLVLRPAGSMASGRILLFEIDANWNRPLIAGAGGELAWRGEPVSGPVVYELQGFASSEPLLFDVTEHGGPVRLTDPTPVWGLGNWRVQESSSGGMRRHYLAVRAPRRLVPQADLELRQVVALRSRLTCPDMLIVTHPDLEPAAQRLAAHRRSHLPGLATADVLVTTTRDIYDNFSGGRQDPLAIRNWVKFLWNLSPEKRLAYLLVLGDGTRDPRRMLAESSPTLVPAVHPQYADSRSRRTYPVEDWFVALSNPSLPDLFAPWASLSVGRLPARDLTEAERMVDRIVEYETGASWGPWRGNVLLAADDECNPSVGCREEYFVGQSEELAAGLPTACDVTKVYETEYPLVDYQKPAARAALIQAWSEGCALLSYQGRGGASQWADEVFFLSTDVSALANATRLPLVLAYHVKAAEFDRTYSQSYMELLVGAPNGGAIAAIGSTTITYMWGAQKTVAEQFEALFPSGMPTRQPLGVVHQLSKWMHSDATDGIVLLGDPALVLRIPPLEVQFTAGADSLMSGRRRRIEGIVREPGTPEPLADFNGRLAIEILGDAETSGYRRSEPPELEIPYVLPGAPICRGEVEVQAGRFAFEFTVPATLPGDSTNAKSTLLGPGGRIGAYAWSATADAKGGRDGVVIVRNAPPDPSLGSPQIHLAFPGEATRVTPGDTLHATLGDENGIWIAGTDSASSIWLRWDEAEALDVTASYRWTGSSDASGALSMPLPALPAGKHQVTLTASDNLGEVATAILEFEIVDSPVLQLAGFRAAPNPTRLGADFTFILDVPAEINLELFSVDGRLVYHSSASHDGRRRGLVHWNGKGDDGRMVASGVYLYALGVRPAGAASQEFTGKLAVLR